MQKSANTKIAKASLSLVHFSERNCEAILSLSRRAFDKNDGEHEFRDCVHFQRTRSDASPSERARRPRVRGVGGRRGSREFEARIHHRNPVRVNSLQPAADHELTLLSFSRYLPLSSRRYPKPPLTYSPRGNSRVEKQDYPPPAGYKKEAAASYLLFSLLFFFETAPPPVECLFVCRNVSRSSSNERDVKDAAF